MRLARRGHVPGRASAHVGVCAIQVLIPGASPATAAPPFPSTSGIRNRVRGVSYVAREHARHERQQSPRHCFHIAPANRGPFLFSSRGGTGRPSLAQAGSQASPEPPPRSQPEALNRAPFSGTPPASFPGGRGNRLTYRAVLLGAHERSFTAARKKLPQPGSLRRRIAKRFARSPSDELARGAGLVRAEGLRIARQALWLARRRFPSYRWRFPVATPDHSLSTSEHPAPRTASQCLRPSCAFQRERFVYARRARIEWIRPSTPGKRGRQAASEHRRCLRSLG
jgi:hypothetical protein